MKKTILLTLLVSLAAVSLRAQEIPDRKRSEFKPIQKEKIIDRKEIASLNLSDEQKTKLKSLNQDLRKQADDLRKQDNLTVKESHEKLQALHAEHLSQLQSILTPEQKAQMQKDREGRQAKVEQRGSKRLAKMKEELNLTDDQSSKLAENRKATAEKIKAVRENSSLKDEDKSEQVKELMKSQRESTKSILTKEQLQKMRDNSKHHKKHQAVS